MVVTIAPGPRWSVVVLPTLLLSAALAVPEPLDGLLRWNTEPAQGEEALAEAGAEGTVFADGFQIWMQVRVDGADCSITWTDRDRLFWVECVREFADRQSALRELNRGRSRLPAPDRVSEDQTAVILDWERRDFWFGLWLAPSEKSPGKWSTGRKWSSKVW